MRRHQITRWAIILYAVLLMTGVTLALACGPVSSTSPGGDAAAATEQDTPQKTPTPTPTPEMIYLEGPDGTPVLVPVPPTPLLYKPVLPRHLQRRVDEYKATKEARGGGVSGASSRDETEYLIVWVATDTADRVDEIADFLNKNGARNVETYRGNAGSVWPGGLTAEVPISLLAGLAGLEGVVEVGEQEKPQPAGNYMQVGPRVSPLEAHGVQTWHLAGVGRGIFEPPVLRVDAESLGLGASLGQHGASGQP